MQSLGLEAKNPTIFKVIADIESDGKEIEFEEFLDAITSRLGDKETRVHLSLVRSESTASLTSSMTIEQVVSVSSTYEE
jgi:hypothetical protein